MPQSIFDNKSALVQVMIWWRQGTSSNWANDDPDLCRHMFPLAHNDLNETLLIL